MNYTCHYGTPGYHALYQLHYLRSIRKRGGIDLKQRQDAFAVAASIYRALTGKNLVSIPVTGEFNGQNRYRLDIQTKEQFFRKVEDIGEKIRDAIFPFSTQQNEQIKNILYRLTGTEEDGTYSNGNNLYGKEVKSFIRSNLNPKLVGTPSILTSRVV